MSARRQSSRSKATLPTPLRVFFAIFMIVVFVGMGLILLCDPKWCHVIYDPSWNWLRWVGGPIFILYGFFRGYRLYVGTRPQNEDPDEWL